MKRAGTTGIGVCALLLGVLLYCYCSKQPTKPTEEPKLPLTLSLETEGRRQAVFSGAPILAIVESADSVAFTALNWHVGRGEFSVSPATLLSSGKRFEALLQWKTMPILRDSSGRFYDSVFLSIGGGLKTSNSVKVAVTNLGVVIDSVRINTTTLVNKDSTWRVTVADNVSQITVRIYAHDYDGATVPKLNFSGDGGRMKLQPGTLLPFVVTYDLPSGKFSSSVVFVVFDGGGSQAIRTISFGRENLPPLFDSIIVNRQSFGGSAPLVTYIDSVIDTVSIRVVARDPNAYDTLRLAWRAFDRTNLRFDSTGNSRLGAYICPSTDCRNPLINRTVVVDTVVIKAYDKNNDTVFRYVRIVHGRVNAAPTFASVRFGDTVLRAKDSVVTVRVIANRDYSCAIAAADTNKDSISYSWTTVRTGRLSSVVDSSGIYRSIDTLGNDTLTLTVSDREFTAKKRIAVIVTDCDPVFDSLAVNDTVYKGADSVFTFPETVLRDTLRFTAYVRDKDPRQDTLRYTWSVKDTSRLFVQSANKILFRCADSTRSDTVRLTLADGIYRKNVRMVVSCVSHAPTIDSIWRLAITKPSSADTMLFKTSDSLYHDTVKVSDSLTMQCFAGDKDKGETLKYYWSSGDSTRLTSASGSARAVYLCRASAGVDTISVRVEDLKKKSARKRIALTIAP